MPSADTHDTAPRSVPVPDRSAVGASDQREAEASRIAVGNAPASRPRPPGASRPGLARSGSARAGDRSADHVLRSRRAPPEPGLRHELEMHFGRDFASAQIHTGAGAGLDRGAAHVAASHGVAGPARPLPFAGLIQRAFGHHEVSKVQAHTDDDAAAGARAMGALAFATGDHVVFASEPDLHTAAHEAAHVVQQRSGLHLTGDVGRAGDPHEQRANLIADRVVRGVSAEDLLNSYPSGSSPIRSPAVQQQPAGGAWQAPTSAHDPNAPAARNATAKAILSAANDKQGQERLDIAWIEALPVRVKTSIDEGFADSVAQAAFKRTLAADPGLKQIDRQRDLAEKMLRADAVKRLAATDPTIRHKRGAVLDKAFAKDPTFTTQDDQLRAVHQLAVWLREAQLMAASDQPKVAGKHEDFVATLPPGTEISQRQGMAFQRTNFMSWAIDILGSAAAVKQHFQHIRKVSDSNKDPNGGMFLLEDAAKRFEDARADFEAAHPGYTFPVTDVAFDLRDHHQSRAGIGMQGHALGIAFDLWALDNPNQKVSDAQNDTYDYLLRRFGGTAGLKGRNIMTLGKGEATIAQLGQDTALHHVTPQGTAMVETISTQFTEMVATSKRFQAAMAGQLPLLSEARDLYFNAQEAEKNPVTSKDSPTPEEMRVEVSEKLSEAFAEWIADIDANLDDARARQDLDAIPTDGPDTADAFSAYADQHKLAKPVPAGTGKAYKAFLKDRLAEKYPRAKSTDPLSPVYLQNEIAALTMWRGRLLDPAFVFGKGKVVSAEAGSSKHWATVRKVTMVPLMQLIEYGFVRQDDLPARSSSGSKTEVFGVEVVTTLARFGFSPGATFRDTMHFDFIEGYAHAPGGRAWFNMQKNQYGPSGNLTPATPRPPQKKTK